MDLPFSEWIEDLRVGMGLVPPALIVIVLLAGPTTVWLLFRFVVQPRSIRSRALDGGRFWVCPNCRSVNGFRLSRCYRCDSQPADADLEIVDARPSGPRRLTPVGPGLDLGAPRPATQPRPLSSLEGASGGWESRPWLVATDDVDPESEEAWDEELEEDRAELPDVAAMTEVIEAPGRRRAYRPPDSFPVAPSRPAVVRPQRVAVAGPAREPNDDPPAA